MKKMILFIDLRIKGAMSWEILCAYYILKLAEVYTKDFSYADFKILTISSINNYRLKNKKQLLMI